MTTEQRLIRLHRRQIREAQAKLAEHEKTMAIYQHRPRSEKYREARFDALGERNMVELCEWCIVKAKEFYRQEEKQMKHHSSDKGAVDFGSQDAKLFEGVEYLVEATDQEYNNLWSDFAHESSHRRWLDVNVVWHREASGYNRRIGEVAGRPICVQLCCASLNKHRVMFYDGVSELVDWDMIEKWRLHYAKAVPRCNAKNFHQCLDLVRGK